MTTYTYTGTHWVPTPYSHPRHAWTHKDVPLPVADHPDRQAASDYHAAVAAAVLAEASPDTHRLMRHALRTTQPIVVPGDPAPNVWHLRRFMARTDPRVVMSYGAAALAGCPSCKAHPGEACTAFGRDNGLPRPEPHKRRLSAPAVPFDHDNEHGYPWAPFIEFDGFRGPAVVACPLCGGEHVHGRLDGHRVPHCVRRLDGQPRGYIVAGVPGGQWRVAGGWDTCRYWAGRVRLHLAHAYDPGESAVDIPGLAQSWLGLLDALDCLPPAPALDDARRALVIETHAALDDDTLSAVRALVVQSLKTAAMTG